MPGGIPTFASPSGRDGGAAGRPKENEKKFAARLAGPGKVLTFASRSRQGGSDGQAVAAGGGEEEKAEKNILLFVLRLPKSFLPLHPLPEGSDSKSRRNRGRKGEGEREKRKKIFPFFLAERESLLTFATPIRADGLEREKRVRVE
jgi:hypothetical protein